jgi:hypothetical protein
MHLLTRTGAPILRCAPTGEKGSLGCMADDPDKPHVTLPSESTEIPSLPRRNSNADPPAGLARPSRGVGDGSVPPHSVEVPAYLPSEGRHRGETVRETVTRSIREAKAAMAQSERASVNNDRFSPGDLVVLISCALFAEPFCHAGADAFLHEHYDKAALGFLIGLPPGIAGGSFHWWKKYLNAAWRKITVGTAIALGIVGAVLVFAYVAGPEMYRRATVPVPTSQNPPTGDEISRATDPLKAKISELRAALEDMTRQRNEALRQSPRQSLPPSNPDSGPITWQDGLSAWSTGDQEGPLFLGVVLRGTSSDFVDLKDAYFISEMTGEKKTLQIGIGPGPKLAAIAEINQIPPGAPIELWATFDPPLRPLDFSTKWARFRFHAEYSGTIYDRFFDGAAMARTMSPNVGPHVTKKVPDK